MRVTVKPKRWWWPPDRKKAKIMTVIANHFMPEIEPKVNQQIKEYLIYGKINHQKSD